MRDERLLFFCFFEHCTRSAVEGLRLGAWRYYARLLAMGWCSVVLAACTSTPAPYGEVEGERFGKGELVQSDTNRMATLAMQQNLESLFSLMDKLYKRNPSEWPKTADSREAAMEFVRLTVLNRQGWAPLGQARDVKALSRALDAEFADDRVAAFIYSAADTVIAAHGGKTFFTMIDGLNSQAIYNAARNMEIASWILATRKKTDGSPLLLANEMGAAERNLSFEREMSKVIARLDLMAVYGTEKYRRAAIGYGQGLVGGPLMQFLPVDALATAATAATSAQ
ncbi:hypothetical protein E9531_07440 [Lampropedia puyangensis]|uniref:Uncharacterized protein n=2 Tax=Lampropedia puyangensis TaxID=1330072 RepID=A0A4S8F5Y9_9BURK|nr:hypothetical protein E9531_07440 [Lampropedia puyangensis]